MSAAATMLALASTAMPADFTVLNLNDNGAGSLRQAISDANAQPGADRIQFTGGLLGIVVLTSGHLSITGHLTIDGPGAEQLVVSGNHQSRIFRISGGATVGIAGLTIRDGMAAVAPTDGGGILNLGSALTLTGVVLTNNRAVSLPGAVARGGAVANLAGGTLNVTDCAISGNEAIGGNSAGTGNTGGIFTADSRVTVHRTAFIANHATGGPGGGQAIGGGFTTTTGAIGTITDSVFAGNQVISGDGGAGTAFGRGGGIYNNVSTLSIEGCVIENNMARGGSNNIRSGPRLAPGGGGGIFNADAATLFLSRSIVKGNQAIGGSNNISTGGNGFVGNGIGGGLTSVGTTTVTDCVFEENEAQGGSGNRGDGVSVQFVGTGFGGGIATAAENLSGLPVRVSLCNVTLRHNRATGGNGNTAGTFLDAGIGGALWINGSNNNVAVSSGCEVTLWNSSIEHNLALGGSGGEALGGGVANTLGGILTITGSTLAHNRAEGVDGGSDGHGGHGFGGGLFNGEASVHPSNPGSPTVLTIEGSTITANQVQGGAAVGVASSPGAGVGGGIWSGSTLTISDSSLKKNMARGGDSVGNGSGGNGAGGALYVDGSAIILATAVNDNRALGGDGIDGSNAGSGLGGGAYNESTSSFQLVRSVVTGNHANAGKGGLGEGIGGAVYDLGLFTFDSFTAIFKNHASTSHDDIFGTVD